MSEKMKHVFNDGGRQSAGYKGRAGDCVARAIAIVAELPYDEVYDRLARGMEAQRATKRTKKQARSARNGIYVKRKWFKDYMAELGFVWTPTMQIGQGCKVHLAAGELPPGKLVVALSRHYTAVLDGVIHDTYNPQREAWTNVAGPHHPDGDREPIAELGETKNENGVWRLSRRCVYGYWRKS
jgi:hypothetical protein